MSFQTPTPDLHSRVLSAMQPSGVLTIGNYLGAIKNWLKMQDSHNCIFFLADLHALTAQNNSELFRDNLLYSSALYIASGLNPEKSILFKQSEVYEHVELSWLLGCFTQTGWLDRMTQFKDKSLRHKKECVPFGLYSYPVLMAADILIYHTKYVPIGEDQKQHIELTRDIAGAVNRFLGRDYFTLPEPIIEKLTAKIMSLRDPSKKMSKSDPSDASRINMLDDADTIKNKIKKAQTDSCDGVWYDETNRPGISNLLDIYCGFSGNTIEQVCDEFSGKQTLQLKEALSEIIIESLAPIQKRTIQLLNNKDELAYLWSIGAERARKIAAVTVRELKELLGFLSSQ